MGNRDYKNFTKGSIYHIYNRGNNREIIFRDEQDYRAFLFRLGLVLGIKKEHLNNSELTKSPKSRIRIESLEPGSFKLHAFCLMPNHFHLLVEQCSEETISKLFLKFLTSFSRYVNLKHKRVGYVFQDRFKAVQIESNSQLMLISSYIHMNPVKDDMVRKPENYKWSSYNDLISDKNNHFIDDKFLVDIFGGVNNFIKQNERLYTKMLPEIEIFY